MLRQLLASVCLAALSISGVHAQNTATIDDLLRSGYKIQPNVSVCDRNVCIIYLDEPITGDLYKKLQALIEKRDPTRPVQVYVDSLGGDLDAAIRIGRLFRQSAPVTAVVTGVCASACVFSLVGATTRIVGGRVAIHRPYTVDSAARSYADLQNQFVSIDNVARRYLSEMNIAPTLYDEMLRYPPESARVLITSDLERYRVSGTDFVWEEAMQRRHAQNLGIGRQAYVERLGVAERVCTTPSSKSSKESTEQLADRLVAWSECRSRVLATGR